LRGRKIGALLPWGKAGREVKEMVWESGGTWT